MKKIILSIAVLGTIAFAGCSNDDDGGNSGECDSCSSSATGFDIDAVVCDNGDGTYTITSTIGVPGLGDTTDEETFDFEEGQVFSDLSCEDIIGAGFSL